MMTKWPGDSLARRISALLVERVGQYQPDFRMMSVRSL